MANTGAGSKADAAVKLVLVFFVSLLSFSVGTFVGKKVSDANHRRADLENEYSVPGAAERAVASADKASPDTEAVSDEEVAALTKEFVEAERDVASTGAATETTAAKTTEGYKKMGETEVTNKAVTQTTKAPTEEAKKKMAAAKNDKVKSAADRIAKDMAPAKDIKKVKKPVQKLPGVATTAIGKYTVQVASYATEGRSPSSSGQTQRQGLWSLLRAGSGER